MNRNILNTIMGRSSYRGKYSSQTVPREHLRLIMEAGLAAPSGCNKQTTSLIAVDDPILLARIKKAINPAICETAPAILCVLTERINAYRNKCYSIQDYSAAIENMLIALKELGYDSCWYEGHITDDDDIAGKIATILEVPASLDLVCILPVGIAVEPMNQTIKKPFEERAWFNGYRN